MKVIIEVRPYRNRYLVWQEGGTVGPMARRMGARECRSKEETLKVVAELLPEYEIPPEVDKAEQKLLHLKN